MKLHVKCFNVFIDIQTSKELIQMDTNKHMRNICVKNTCEIKDY